MQKITIILLLLVNLISYGQHSISSKIVDEYNRPVSRVHVWVDETLTGTLSNKKGEFTLSVETFPVNIHISHLSFEKQKIKLESADDLQKVLVLKSNIETLPTVSISTERVIDLTKGYWYDISDFEIYQDHVLLLAYQWKRKQNPWLIMLNAYGDTLWSSYLGRDGELYKDCLGQIHLVNKKAAYQIFIEEDNFQLYPAITIKEFEEELKPCIDSHNDKIYLEQYTYANQILNYYEGDLKDTSVHRIASIADEKAMRWMHDDAMGLSPLRNEHEQRFEQLFFYDPIYAPLIKRGDTTIIFDFVNDEIGQYSSTYETISLAKIDFHKTLKWKEKLFIDEKTQKVYTMFRRGGFHNLNEIDLYTGKLENNIDIPQFTFIGKLRVHEGQIFFLYRDREEDQALTKLYKMRNN